MAHIGLVHPTFQLYLQAFEHLDMVLPDYFWSLVRVSLIRSSFLWLVLEKQTGQKLSKRAKSEVVRKRPTSRCLNIWP